MDNTETLFWDILLGTSKCLHVPNNDCSEQNLNTNCWTTVYKIQDTYTE